MPPSWIYDDSGEAIIHLTRVDPADRLVGRGQKSERHRCQERQPPRFLNHLPRLPRCLKLVFFAFNVALAPLGTIVNS